MNEYLRRAEIEVIRARRDLADDFAELRGWLLGVTPLMHFLRRGPRFRPCAPSLSRDGEAPRAGAVSLFLIAFGVGLVVQDAVPLTRKIMRPRRRSKYR